MLVIGMDNYRLFPRFIDGQEDLVLSRSVITNNIIVGGKTQKNLKEDGNKTTQCRTVTCGDPDTDALLKFLSSTEIPNPLKRCGKCKSCDQCKNSYLPDQEKNETMLGIIKQNVV